MNFKRKKSCKTTVILLSIAIGLLSLTTGTLVKGTISDTTSTPCILCPSHSEEVLGTKQPAKLCSVLTATYGETVLFGGNVDSQPHNYSGTTPYIVVFPPSEEDHRYGSGYGFVAIGWKWEENGRHYEYYPCGMNEKGLAFGKNGLPSVSMNPHPERLYSSPSDLFWVKAMRECSSVACVIELASNFDWGSDSSTLNQYHFADAAGDAVVISAGPDGELAFSKKDKNWLISTNFNLKNTENGKYPCWRYDTAGAMLEEITDEITVEYVESVLDAIHQEGIFVNTVYSYIFDLRTGDGYVYYFHQFDEAAEFNLSVELAESAEGAICSYHPFDNLFSQEIQNKAAYGFWEYQKYVIILKIGVGVAGLVGFSFFIYKKVRNRTSEPRI